MMRLHYRYPVPDKYCVANVQAAIEIIPNRLRGLMLRIPVHTQLYNPTSPPRCSFHAPRVSRKSLWWTSEDMTTHLLCPHDPQLDKALRTPASLSYPTLRRTVLLGTRHLAF